MHGSWLVLRRTIHGVQYQGCRASVDELMLCACWYDDEVACFDVLILARDSGAAGAGCEGQDLVDGVFLEIGQETWGGERMVLRGRYTSSPISPSIGTVMRTS